AVPHVEPERQRGIAPLDDAVELAVEVLRALEPEALPHQHLGMAQQQAQELDERAVDEALARTHTLEEVPHRRKDGAHALDVDAALPRLAPAMGAEAARRRPLHHAVERRIALVAPHDAVDRVAAAVLLDHAVPPQAVVGVRRAGLAADAAEQIDLHAL